MNTAVFEKNDRLRGMLWGLSWFSGTIYGYSAIPERWLAAVKDRKNIDKLIDDFIVVCQE